MLGIGVLVHVQRTTGSFAITGAVSGALAIAQGVGGAARPPRRPPRPAPGAGRFGRGRRERPRRHGAAARRSAVAALLALAAAVGFATPPMRACLRALLPSLVGDPAALRRAYAADSTAVELTWIAGPPLVLLSAAATSTRLALIVAGALPAVATLAFAAAPASRTGVRSRPRRPRHAR
jgi:hypothetical protein